MSEQLNKNTPDKSRRALATGLTVGLTLGGVAGTAVGPDVVEAAQRMFTPPEATAEAVQPIQQAEFAALLEKALESKDLKLIDAITVQEGVTRLSTESLSLIESNPDLQETLEQNRANIQFSLLESSKLANTNQPDTPYMTHDGQTYGIYETDLNGDGLNEYIVRLKPVDALPVDATGTIPSPETH